MDNSTRSYMESRFNYDFSDVRIHNNDRAAKSADSISAIAYTFGNNIVFNKEKYSPNIEKGKGLLAHELTHVMQQNSKSSKVQRFASDEHVKIGNNSVPGINTFIRGYGTIPYKEMIAIAGDYFESIDQIQLLAESYGDFGKHQIDIARWKVNPSNPKPNDPDAESAVNERYYILASKNQTHFSTGSSPGNSNKEKYIAGHTEAIKMAYIQSGFITNDKIIVPRFDFEALEAFADHYLTDAFSAGHVRTPRGNIQQWFKKLYPSFNENLVSTISCFMASYINDVDNIGYVLTVDMLTSRIAEQLRSIGGVMLSSFDIGDLISKVLHDADSTGLDVVSASDSSGSTGSTPYKWHSVGDGNLYSSINGAKTTQDMVQAAVTLSHNETKYAYEAGMKSNPSLSTLTDIKSYRALNLIPVEDTSSKTNPIYAWQVNSIDSLPANIKTLLISIFSPSAEIGKAINALNVPATVDSWGFTLHTGDAWNCFKKILLGNPFAILIRVANGQTCPAEKNNPCTTT